MPKRTDIHKILVIGSGPIVIGQAAEFDYAGTQACLALQGGGLRGGAGQLQPRHHHDRHRHRRQGVHGAADAGIRGQDPPLRAPGRHCARHRRADGPEPGHAAGEEGRAATSARWNCWAPTATSIERAEDRELFKELCEELGEPVLPSIIAHSIEEGVGRGGDIGYPVVLRPAFTLGGTGGGFADDEEELRAHHEKRPQALPGASGAGGKEHQGLQGDRVRGDARQQRHRHHHLQHGKRRSRGHPHRRLHRGRPQPDADQQGIPHAARQRAAASSAR